MAKRAGTDSQDAENEHARGFVRGAIQRDFAGNQTAAGKSWGIPQSLLSDFLAGKRGLGIRSLAKLAQHYGMPHEAILGRASYPNRTHAVAWFREESAESGLDPELVEQAIQQVCAIVAVVPAVDPPIKRWLKQLEYAYTEAVVRAEPSRVPQAPEGKAARKGVHR